MYSEATLSLMAQLERLGKYCRRQLFSDSDGPNALASYGMLFQKMGEGGRIRMSDASPQPDGIPARSDAGGSAALWIRGSWSAWAA